MAGTIVDMVTALLILGMTYALTSEGLWGAALMFFNALFAAMITLNCYEPLAQAIGSSVSFLSGFADAMCILLIYPVSLLLLRLATEHLSPAMVRFPMPLYHLGRFIFGLGGSVITIGILLIALNASPVQKRMFGVVDYKYKPFFTVRFDKEILAYFQYATGMIFTRPGPRDPFGEFGNTRVFDPRGEWLLKAQDARPHGTGDVLGGDEEKADAGAAGGEASPAGAGGAAPTGSGPGIPGGTAGAAAGLAPTN